VADDGVVRVDGDERGAVTSRHRSAEVVDEASDHVPVVAECHEMERTNGGAIMLPLDPDVHAPEPSRPPNRFGTALVRVGAGENPDPRRHRR
jgi:hypothetical protein